MPATVRPFSYQWLAHDFAYDADEQATYRWRRTGHRGFVCCAETVGRETPAEVTT